MSDIKKPTSEQEKRFLDLVISGMPIGDAAEEADYARGYGYQLGTKFKEYILDGVQGMLYLAAVKAGNVMVDTMDADGKVPEGALRLKAAEGVMDRAGLAKQERLTLEIEEHKGVFVLPAKANGSGDRNSTDEEAE
tara:strand:+ start:523 stop:930 length:408 start_codon:yes stop_codon:yes gene_type:complete